MILVTGGAGYIGSHCVMALLKNNIDVVIYDNLSTGHLETVKKLQNFGNVIFEQGDLLDYEHINKLMAKYKDIDAVIHFAAFSQVGESMENPQKYYINNVCGTLNLLHAMLENKILKIVFSSTAATYGEPKYIPIDELHPQIPINPYGQTKLMIERIMDDYNRAYGLRSVRLRYFNVIGADDDINIGEWHDPETHLVPNILKSCFGAGKTFNLFGDDYDTRDGTCVRDYVNVVDLANAHILALKYLENGGETNFFNIGTNSGNTVREIFDACEKTTGKKIALDVKPRRIGDPGTLVADNTKAQNVLGWKPKHSLSDSIKTAYDWEVKLQNK